MEKKHYIGIYISRTHASAVVLDGHGHHAHVTDRFTVNSTEGHNDPAELAKLIKDELTQRKIESFASAAALDCAWYMQHGVHSDFNDMRQIAATVRFDAEEALTTDISKVAIAFRLLKSGQTGSSLDVYTAQRDVLQNVLGPLQANGIDPVTVEPDANCLWRYLSREAVHGDELVIALSGANGYFIHKVEHEAAVYRTFLTGNLNQRTDVLCRELLMTVGTAQEKETLQVKLIEDQPSVDIEALSKRTGIAVSRMQLEIADEGSVIEYAIAYGAAMADADKDANINFRKDFMPYLGKKRQMENQLKWVGIIAAAVIVLIGAVMQIKLWNETRPLRELRQKFAREYSVVMTGQSLPKDGTNPTTKLKSTLRKLQERKSGQLSSSGEQSIVSKLTTVLEAFNKCSSETGLKIDTINMASKDIRIAGTTRNRNSTLKLFETLRQAKIEVEEPRLEEKNGVDNFTITARIAK